ncbi:MAG TPA: YdeI/OmpD-associated family protein [Anaerolineales bacterium]|nr:YdeI/OmpD-associated family protein [Anaerolineales bacterium]
MKITQTFTAPDRPSWHDWLAEHGATESEVWLVYFKAAAGKPTISYEDSLEEALCFGWVDSLIQKIDEEKYARKFTPRKLGSKWSELNKHLVAKLVKEGRMTAAGLDKVEFPLEEAKAERPKRPALPLPDWLRAGLMTSPTAWENFQKLAPSHQRNYIGWISDAKKEETRQRRLQTAIAKLEKNEKLGLI